MKLTGLIAATYTPFREDGSVNLDLIPAMIDYMIESGVSGFYVCGSTGEGESMSVEERKQVAQASVSATKGRLPVVVQVGHNSVESACELASHAAEVGADAISTLPPTYFKPASVDLLVNFIARVSSCAPDLPYYYYHIPRMSGVSPDIVEFMQKACDRVPRFHGIKFSDFFLADLTTCLEFDNARLDILFGSDEMILGALATGAKGAVGSSFGFAAPLLLQIIAAYEAGKMEEAQTWMGKTVRLIRTINTEPGPFHSCVKQVVWPLLGFEVGSCRVPQAMLSEEEVDHARARLEESGFASEIASGDFQLP
jgi:N-acetylneuraminate lyase